MCSYRQVSGGTKRRGSIGGSRVATGGLNLESRGSFGE